MKKQTIRSLIMLALVLVVYHLIVFIIPFERELNFWVSYGFTLASFAELYTAFYIGSVYPQTPKSRFYGFPIVRIGFIYAGVQSILGLLFMILGENIAWEAVVLIQAIALIAAALGLIITDSVADNIMEQDNKLKNSVSLMRGIHAKLDQMVGFCDDSEAAAAVKALAEEVRYSDPVSSPATAAAEADLAAAVDALQGAVADNDVPVIKDLCRKTSATLADRNRICKLSK